MSLLIVWTIASAAAAPTVTEVPCATPPVGMACVPGGPAIVGADDHERVEQPKRTVTISTFYMDKHEITHAQYQQCVDAGGCPPLDILPINKKIMVPFMGANQPAMPLDWERAHKFCVWAGKRLPTEWEWEKAARGPNGDLYPWGNAAPTCDRAQFRECAPKGCKPYPGKSHEWDCVEHATKPVGSFPAGHYGLFDMAGNGYEWTSTWAGPDPKASPCAADAQDCNGVAIGGVVRDPRGPCDGGSSCKAGGMMRVLRGGSWYWPADMIRGSWRRPEWLETKSHRLGARCASSTPTLAGFPTKLGSEKRPAPATPKVPSAEQRKLAHDVTEDKLEKQVCAEKGRAFLDCRDPNSYIKSNEPRQHLWAPYIENLGGGYTGVGIDQNYSFIALQKAEWAWLFDYDPTVVRLHWVLRAVILDSPDRASFVDHFGPASKDRVLTLLNEQYKDHPERAAFGEVYTVSRNALQGYYTQQLDGNDEDKSFGWLAREDAYQYVRTMFQQDRIVIMKGDMLAANAMQSIGKAARAVGTTIRVYYPSNAPECWRLTDQYKQNVLALPFDERSVVLQTLSGARAGFEKQKGYWHYNVQSGLQQQDFMKRRYNQLRQHVYIRYQTNDSDLTVSGLERANP